MRTLISYPQGVNNKSSILIKSYPQAICFMVDKWNKSWKGEILRLQTLKKSKFLILEIFVGGKKNEKNSGFLYAKIMQRGSVRERNAV